MSNLNSRRHVPLHATSATAAPVAPAVPAEPKRSPLPAPSPLRAMLNDEMPVLDFVLPGLLRGTVGAFIGPGGVGKSFWAMQFAISIAAGVDLIGLKPSKGSVLYLSGEDADVVHAQRMRAMTAGAPKGFDLSASLDLRTTQEQPVDVMDDETFEALVAAGKGRDLVVFDTLTRFHNLDENSARDMKMLMARLERIASRSGAAVVYLHHTGKAAVLNGMVAVQQAARGSSVLVDNARWSCFLATMTESEAKRYNVPAEQREQYVRWNISKQNYGERVPDVWYQRMAGGVLRTHTEPWKRLSPLNELTRLPTDPQGRPLAHMPLGASLRPLKVVPPAAPADHNTVIARGINGDSTQAERAQHATAMAAASGRAMTEHPSPPSATNAFNNKW